MLYKINFLKDDKSLGLNGQLKNTGINGMLERKYHCRLDNLVPFIADSINQLTRPGELAPTSRLHTTDSDQPVQIKSY